MTISKITIFRSPQTNRESNEYRYFLDNDRDFSWKIYNPSGCPLEDQAYEGMGEIHVITPAQAIGEKKAALTNCALYTSRQNAKRYGDVIPNSVSVVIQ